MAREQIKEGALVRLKSGTEGWIKGQVVEYTDLITYPPLGVAIYTGSGYKVYILEGKHKGQTIRVPGNYVELLVEPGKAIREPLYPHVPKSRQPLFPHAPKGQQAETKLPQTLPQTRKQFIEVGERVRFIGSSRGRYETWPKDAWLEKGVTGTVKEYHPEQPAVRVGGKDFEALPAYAVVRWDFGGETVINPDDEHERWERIPKTEVVPQTKEKLYQRGPDGYPVGADKIMRDAWGPIPDPAQPFWSGKGFIKPVKIYGWQWSADYHSWRAYVRFPDGTETWTSPLKQTGGSLELLASTEGDPIRKFCCRQCGECAPREFLEEGRFLDRISWLRSHYKDKHPGMWGKMSPMTVEDGEPVSPEYRNLAGPAMSVKLWTGKIIPVKDRDEAVKVIKEEMKGWMQEGDRLIWYNTDEDNKLGRKPSFAVVVNEVGEETDASALIRYGKPEVPKSINGEPVPPQYRHLIGLISEPLPKEAD